MSGNSNDVYLSFIKINGKSILPPLLDEVKREEMRHYRDLAISVGLKIKQHKQEEQVNKVSAVDESTETVEEPLSPTLTASTDLNQFLDSTLDASPQPPTDATPGRLIRSASYTLDQPSVSLLAAVEASCIKPCSALQAKSPKHSVKSPMKVVCRRKKKLLASPRLSKKISNSKTNKSVFDASMNIDSEDDDLHLDLDLHLNLPSTIAGAYLNHYESVAIQTTSSNHVSTQINILDSPQYPPVLSELQPCPKLLNDCNDGAFSDSKICQFTLLPDEIIEEIIEKDLINFESDAFDDEEIHEQTGESCTVQNIVRRSQSTPEFSRAATATQTDLSPISQDDTSCSLSETEEAMSTSRAEGQNLHTMVNNIQSEYEMKLSALMKQQEIEKQKLKEQFLQQQDLLFQKLTISMQTSPRTPLPDAPSPPIHQTRGDGSTPRKPLSMELCQKFARLPALVRGYLTRRLMHTERVQNIKATVRETLNLAVHLHSQPPPLHPTDIALHGRLIQQLDQALAELHDIFFSLPLPKRLHIITLDRERLRKGSSTGRSSSGSRISSATLKAQQRRQQLLQQQQNPVSPHVGPGGDVSSGIIRRSRSRDNKLCFHRSTSDSSTKQSNGDTLSEAKARKHSDRRGSIPKNKRPWR